ncbi:MAG: hypothetical protein AAF709_07815 [Pseudomonadota bacterium]
MRLEGGAGIIAPHASDGPQRHLKSGSECDPTIKVSSQGCRIVGGTFLLRQLLKIRILRATTQSAGGHADRTFLTRYGTKELAQIPYAPQALAAAGEELGLRQLLTLDQLINSLAMLTPSDWSESACSEDHSVIVCLQHIKVGLKVYNLSASVIGNLHFTALLALDRNPTFQKQQ